MTSKMEKAILRNRYLIAFCLIIYVIYYSPIHTIYYFADESHILIRTPDQIEFFSNLWNRGLSDGRPMTWLLLDVLTRVAAIDHFGLQIVRVAQFSASLVTGLLLIQWLTKRRLSTTWSLAVVLFIWCQPTIQAIHVYAILTPYLLGVWLSFLSFFLVVESGDRLSGIPWRRTAAFVLLLVSWTSFQAAPFAGLAPMIWYIMTSQHADWSAERRNYLTYISFIFGTMIVYVIGFKIALLLTDADVYYVAETAFALLSGESSEGVVEILNFGNYLGLFEWWNYLYPFRIIPQDAFNIVTRATAVMVFTIFAFSIYLDRRMFGWPYSLQRLAIVCLSVILTMLPLMADQFTGRPHVYIAASPAIILLVAGSLYRMSWLSGKPLPGAAYLKMAFAVVLVLVVFGAQAGVHRGMVGPGARFTQFVETEILRQAEKDYDRVVVVTIKNFCRYEPCRGYAWRKLSIGDRDWVDTQKYYRSVMRGFKMKYDVPIEYVSDGLEILNLDKTLVVDHRVLANWLERSSE